jgi:hypothetical protein
VTHGAAQVHQPPLSQQDDVAPVSQRVPSQENSVADSEYLSDLGSEFSIRIRTKEIKNFYVLRIQIRDPVPF